MDSLPEVRIIVSPAYAALGLIQNTGHLVYYADHRGSAQ